MPVKLENERSTLPSATPQMNSADLVVMADGSPARQRKRGVRACEILDRSILVACDVTNVDRHVVTHSRCVRADQWINQAKAVVIVDPDASDR